MTVILVSLLSAAYMSGLAWFVGVVHYPLFSDVGGEGWAAYHQRHSDRTTLVVAVPMAAELLSAAWIVADRPEVVAPWLAATGLALAAGTWALTAVAAGLHRALTEGLDARRHRWLLAVHHARTGLWSTHAVLTAVMAGQFA